MKMGAQIRTGKRLPDTGKRFRDRIWAYAQGTQLLALSEFPISIGKSFSGADLYPHFHFQITVEPPRLIFFLSDTSQKLPGRFTLNLVNRLLIQIPGGIKKSLGCYYPQKKKL